jgi:6-pyruvoyltetrahydropterin/6-carboxytetrahydropterin synthase
MTTYRICKQFRFEASHQLTHLPLDHQCARMHGHSYLVEVELQHGSLDPDGFVVDFGLLHTIREYIDRNLDHRHLNDVFGSAIDTTAENIAARLLERFNPMFPYLMAVRVHETAKTWAEARNG